MGMAELAVKEKSLDERGDKGKRKKVNVVQIERHEGKLMLPNNLSVDDAIEQLQEHKKHLEQEMVLVRSFPVFPWDGAAALQRVFTKKYGWVPAQKIPGFFQDTPPTTIAIEVSLGDTQQVPWGRFKIPGVEGYVQTGVTGEDGMVVFQLHASVKRRYERDVIALFDAVHEELRLHSIYRGKAVRVRFTDDDGDDLEMAQINFIPTNVTREQLIYSRDLQDAIETNLFTPIERTADCIANGIPVKRGVLLGGPYGTGKTMAAAVAANLAVQNQITFVYVPRADELARAIAFARQYSSPACVVFCEDVDRVMAGDRSTSMDDILNIIDGIDGKRSNILTVLTSNFTDKINPAMLRPGRLDAVLEVGPPDGEAVQRLIRAYAGDAVDQATDISEVGKELAGNIPAVIAEVVKRAKLAQLRITPRGEQVRNISSQALVEAARTMTRQLRLLAPKEEEKLPTLDNVLRDLVKRSVNGGADTMASVDKGIKALRDRIGC